MAAATVLAIFIFVFATAFDGSSGQGGPRNANATVASWDGGSITEAKLDQLVRQRSSANNVLRQLLFGTATMEELQYQQIPRPSFIYDSQNTTFRQLQSLAIDLEFTAAKAEEAGISVNPAMITEYLKHWTQGRASGTEVKNVFAAVGRGDALNTERAVYATLQKLLLKYHFERSFEDPARVMLPVERWNDWRKVNELVSVQAAVLPIEDFIDEVPDPSNSQLNSFYEEYKDRDSNLVDRVNGRQLPASSPGFAQPATVTLRALKGSLIQWRDKSLDDVTDEAIEKFYEENKDRLFVKKQDESEEETSEAESEEEADEEQDATDEEAKSPEEEETATDDEEEDSVAEETAESDSDTTEATSEATEEANETESATEGNTSEESASSEEEEEEEESEETTDDTADAEQSDAGESETDTSETEDESESSSDADAEEAANEKDTAEDASNDESAAKESSEDEDDRYKVEYQPLDDKLRESIRKQLAMEIASEKLQTQMEKAEQKLSKLYTKYGTAKVTAEQNKEDTPEVPALLRNPEPLAEELGLSYEKIPSMTQRAMIEETLIGKTYEVQGDMRSVANFAFRGSELFEPYLTSEDPTDNNPNLYGNGDWYLIVKVAETPRTVPELEDIKDEVTEAWKRSEAAKLAQARAEELAAEWNKSQPTFFEFFNDKEIKVETTDPFAWLSFPPNAAGRAAPRLTEAPGLENAGVELMETIFSLDDEQAEAALNHDKSIAYVVKIHRRESTKEQLRTTFLNEADSWLGWRQMFQVDQREFVNKVQEQIRERSGFEFDEEWLERMRSEGRE
ncbi:MAG: hypothetical protein RH917_12180 [Lacipirellulaceae bacterium]